MGCTTTTTSPTPVATKTPTQVATPTPTPKPTVTPTPTPTVDYSAKLNSVYSSGEYVLMAPFYKTTLNGREVYVGTVSTSGNVLTMNVYPMKDYAAAKTLREQFISEYKAGGYSTWKTVSENEWQGIIGMKMVDVNSIENSVIGVPVVLVMSGTAI